MYTLSVPSLQIWQSGIYDDMAASMTVYVVAKSGVALSAEERGLLSWAFIMAVIPRRNSLRALSIIGQASGSMDTTDLALAKEYRTKIKNELLDICNNVIQFLDDHLIPSTKPADGRGR